MNLLFYLLLVLVILLLGWGIWTYNAFVQDVQQIREAWGNIDVQLKRRRDLIPSMVEVVKGYSKHESRLLEDVTEKRSESEAAEGTRATARQESVLSDLLANLLVFVEDYPELKADQTYRKLQRALVEIEDDIQYARRYYNGSVRDYNIRRESFPSLIIAALFGFKSKDFFELSLATERRVPDVELP